MMRKSMQFLVPAFLLLLGLRPAFAQQYPYAPTEQEYATLPPYCKEKLQNKNLAEINRWSDSFGVNTWLHMHHYCIGLNDINRYYRASNEQQKKGFLSSAIGEFGYMVGHLPPGSVLLADAYQNRGRVFLLQGQEASGVKDLHKALELNPKIARTYLILADQFERGAGKDKALQIVTEGLRHVPASKGLQRRYQELGGKLPFPEPYEKPAEQNAVAKTMPAEEPKAEAKPEAAPPSGEATNQAADGANLKAPTGPTPQIDPPKIGSPKNPYCRFCPD